MLMNGASVQRCDRGLILPEILVVYLDGRRKNFIMKHAILAVVLTVMASFGSSARGPVSPKPGKIIISSTERSHPRNPRNRDKIKRSVRAATLQWDDLWR